MIILLSIKIHLLKINNLLDEKSYGNTLLTFFNQNPETGHHFHHDYIL